MRFGLFLSRQAKISESWSYETQGQLTTPSATIVHANVAYVIIGTKEGRIICLDETGKERWHYETGDPLSATERYFVDEERIYSITARPQIADINADGTPEILIGTELGRLYCLSLTGKLLFKRDFPDAIRKAIVTEDINRDGKPEIIVASGKRLFVLTGTGEQVFEFDADRQITSVPGVIKAKRTMLVFGTEEGALIAIDLSQNVLWKADLGSAALTAPTPLPSREEFRILLGTQAGVLFCVSEHGEIVWKYKTEGSINSRPEVTNIDGRTEIVFGSCDNKVYALSADGQRLWSYETDFWVTETPLVTDLDGDGQCEIIAGSYDHNLYVLDGRGEYQMDYVPGIAGIVTQAGHYSNILTAEPGEQTGKVLLQYELPDIVVGCTYLPARTGPLVIVTTKDGRVSALRRA